MMTAEQVAEDIKRAFAGVSLGTGVGLGEAEGLDFCESTSELVRLRSLDEKDDWARISPADLDGCWAAMPLFDAEGMRFHLPAYLIGDLEGTLKVALLAPVLAGDQDVFRLLSDAQHNAVRSYLVFQATRPRARPPFELSLIESALEGYWNAR